MTTDKVQQLIDGLCGRVECNICRTRYDALLAAGENSSRLVMLGRDRVPHPPDAAHQKLLSNNNNPNQKGEIKTMSKKKALKKLEKEVARQAYPSVSRPGLVGVDIAGSGASTIGNAGNARQVVSAFLSGLESRVTKSRGEVTLAESSGNAMRQEGARQGLRSAMRARLLGKLVIKTAVEANQGPAQFGRSVFAEGSTYNIGDDAGLGYTLGHGQPPVR